MELLRKLCPQLDIVEWAIVGIVAACIAGLIGLQAHRIDQLKVSVATEKSERASDQAHAASAAASAAIDRLVESSRRITTNQEIDREASRIEAQQKLDADSLAAADVDRRLRNAFRAGVVAGGSAGVGDPGPVAVGAPAAPASGVLADVFDESDRRAGVFAAALDQAHVRGLACEAEYDALKHRVDVARALQELSAASAPAQQAPASEPAPTMD